MVAKFTFDTSYLEDVPANQRLQAIQATTQARWESESDETRASYEAKAAALKQSTGQAHGKQGERQGESFKAVQVQGMPEQADIPEGPLNLARLNGRFPIDPDVLEQHQLVAKSLRE